MDGYPAFAPELASSFVDYPSGVHENLARLEAACFWFRNRNSLIQSSLNQYFSSLKSLLEIGCGTGFVLSGIAKLRPKMHLVGAEIYTSGLKLAQERTPQAEFLQMDACRIPFKEEFDVIGAFDVLEHIENDQCALNEIYGALKRGGGVMITVPQHQWLWSSTDDVACHKRRYSRIELRSKMEAAGFRVLKMSSFVTFLLPLMILSRLKFKIFPMRTETTGPLEELNIPASLNVIFERVLAVESSLIKRGLSLPSGGSLLCVGIKE
jgi:SAM-dependent methyltransferase